MNNLHKLIRFSLAGVFASVMAMPAYANFSWTFSYGSGNCGTGVGNTCTQSSTDVGQTINVSASAWALNGTLETATLNEWDGLAVQSVGESYNNVPDHATDNNGKLESVLFNFTKSVALTSITMGWHGDADFSLLRYTGAGDVGSLLGKTYSGLLSDSWELVGNYTCGSSVGCSNSTYTDADIVASVDGSNPSHYSGPLDANGVSKSVDLGASSSSYWLVVALNGAFWNNSAYIGNDYFKIKNLSGQYSEPPSTIPGVPGVPEPPTIVLLAGVLAYLSFGTRREAI